MTANLYAPPPNFVVIYVALLAFALATMVRVAATLVLVWLYIVGTGAPPSVIRPRVVATFVLTAGLLGRQVSPV
jgi:hypothetical protein